MPKERSRNDWAAQQTSKHTEIFALRYQKNRANHWKLKRNVCVLVYKFTFDQRKTYMLESTIGVQQFILLRSQTVLS